MLPAFPRQSSFEVLNSLIVSNIVEAWAYLYLTKNLPALSLFTSFRPPKHLYTSTRNLVLSTGLSVLLCDLSGPQDFHLRM